MSLRGAESSATKRISVRHLCRIATRLSDSHNVQIAKLSEHGRNPRQQSSLLSNVENFDDKTVNSVSKKFEQVLNNATLKTAEKTAGLPRSQGYLLPRNDMMKRAAFTLAEVLITLGIIGVVAAMTLPALLANYRKQVVVTQLKKSFSEVSQAFKLAEVEHGFMEDWHFRDATNLEDGEDWLSVGKDKNDYFMKEYIVKHLKIVKKCEKDKDSCWKHPKTMSGTDSFCYYHSGYTDVYITASGYSIFGWIAGNGNDGGFCIDVDGPAKGSNVVGKDIFMMYFFLRNDEVNHYSKGLYLYGGFLDNLTEEDILNDTVYGCNTDSTNTWAGVYCGLLIQRNGWEIPKNYPIKF